MYYVPQEKRKSNRGKPGKESKMLNYNLKTVDKKDLVKRHEELTGIKSRYTFMPRCACPDDEKVFLDVKSLYRIACTETKYL